MHVFSQLEKEKPRWQGFGAIRSPTLYVEKLDMLIRPPNRGVKMKFSYSIGHLLEKACWKHSFEDTGINDKQAKYLSRLEETTRTKN